MEIGIEINLRSTNVRKATDKDELPRRFLKDGLQVSSKPISNWAIILSNQDVLLTLVRFQS